MNREFLKLYSSGQTVFTSTDLANYFGVPFEHIRRRISYYAQIGDLIRISRGIYVLDKHYNVLELANKIIRPSYISLDTVLRKAGIIFQLSEEINVISYKSTKFEVDNHCIKVSFLKEDLRNNFDGIEYDNHVWIATKERAFLDAVYLFRDIHFDNLRPLDWKRCFQLVTVYHSPMLEKRLASYHSLYAQHNAA